jgi:hypothetical protein
LLEKSSGKAVCGKERAGKNRWEQIVGNKS